MEITVDQILTYLECPMKYKMKYVYGIKEEKDLKIEFRKALHQITFFYYTSLLNGNMPTMKIMKNKWSHIWSAAFDEVGKVEDFLLKPRRYSGKGMAIRSEAKEAKFNRDGFEMIHNFYMNHTEKKFVPILINQDYRFSFDDITVIGNFELIREILDIESGSRFIDIVDIKTSSSTMSSFLLENDLRSTMASYAFREVFKGKEDRICFHYMKNGEETFTRRSEKDFNRMKAIVKDVVKCIQQEVFYPRQTFLCSSCPFEKECSSLKF